MWMASLVVREVEGDRSAGEHDEGERGLGAMESVGSSGHGSDLVVQSLVAAVGQAPVDGGGDAVGVLADRGGGLDEFGDAGAFGPRAPALEQFHHGRWFQVA